MERKSITILALVVLLLIIFLTYNNTYSNNEIYKILKQTKNIGSLKSETDKLDSKNSDKIESKGLPNKISSIGTIIKNFVKTEPKKIESKNSNSRNVFFDLGANRGDSIENFIGITEKGDGGNIRKKIPSERVNQKWTIYGIEGNPKFDKNLLDIKEKYSSNQYNILLYNSTIVTTYDGKIKFYLDKNDRYGNNVGSSIKENHPDVVLSKKVYEEKPCVDFARLLRQYNENDFIIVKMDIEGAEFDLLLHLIAQNVLKLIDVFALEYHMSLSPFKDTKDVFSQIFKKFNVSELFWS